jgi:6-phosphogluconolactonase
VDASVDAMTVRDGGPIGPTRTPIVYVGQSDGELVVHSLSTASGDITETSRMTVGGDPSFAVLSPNGRFLYVVNEAAGQVIAFSVAAGTGRTTRLNAVSSRGGGPTHVSTDRTGEFVFVANYEGGTVAVLPVQANGSLGAAVDTESPGSNAHAIEIDPSNRWVLVPCLGDDIVAIFEFDSATGELTPRGNYSTAAGAGPRHVAWAPDGSHAYLVNELDSTVDVLSFDSSRGALSRLQTISTLPASFTNSNSTAEILIDPDGQFVYASNRGHNSVAVFAILAGGRLEARGHALLEARTPRSMAIDPSGAFLLAGAQDSDRIVRFRIGADGSLSRLGATNVGAGPTFVGIFGVPQGAP